MSSAPVQNGSPDTRAAILDAARRLFETDGCNVGLQAVAKAGGVSRQAIYLHFESRAALLAALHLRIDEMDVRPAIQRVWSCPDALSAFDAFVAASATAIERIRVIYRATEAASRFDQVARETFLPGEQRRRADCARLAEWLASEDLLQPGVDVPQAAETLFVLVNVPPYEHLVITCGWSRRRWIDWTRASLRRLLIDPAG